MGGRDAANTGRNEVAGPDRSATVTLAYDDRDRDHTRLLGGTVPTASAPTVVDDVAYLPGGSVDVGDGTVQRTADRPSERATPAVAHAHVFRTASERTTAISLEGRLGGAPTDSVRFDDPQRTAPEYRQSNGHVRTAIAGTDASAGDDGAGWLERRGRRNSHTGRRRVASPGTKCRVQPGTSVPIPEPEDDVFRSLRPLPGRRDSRRRKKSWAVTRLCCRSRRRTCGSRSTVTEPSRIGRYVRCG